jgi:hypothetical protein
MNLVGGVPTDTNADDESTLEDTHAEEDEFEGTDLANEEEVAEEGTTQ